MHIICLTPLAKGVYNDHKPDNATIPPEGWAVILHEGDPIPKEWAGKEIDYSLPSTFPRLGSIEAKELTYTREVEVMGENGEPITEEQEYTMMTVTAMTEGTLPDPDLAALEAEVRARRDKLLTETDWTQVLDAPISAESREAFRVYRQALRDITEQEGFPTEVVWPELPEAVKAAPDPVDTAFDVLIGKEEA